MTDDHTRVRSDQCREALSDTENEPLDDERRRALLTAIVGALVTAGVMTPKQAEAQFLGSVGLDVPGLQELIRLLLRVFNLGSPISIPSNTITVVNDLLDLLGAAGGDTVLRSSTVEGAFEARFPTQPARTTDEHQEATRYQVEAVRRIVVQSMQIQGYLAEQQGFLANGEEQIIADAQRGGGGSEGVTRLLQANLAMQGSIAQRLGMICTSLSALTQVVADQRMVEMSGKEQAFRYLTDFIGDDADSVPAPVFRPAQ